MQHIIQKLKDIYLQTTEIDIDVDNFICSDWNVYYNLFNPENFEDPDNAPEWYVVQDVYEYYETPFLNTNQVNIYSSEVIKSFNVFEEFIKNSLEIEEKLLHSIVHYTFGNGGAYAAAQHYEYAKKTMEILHKTEFTNEEFIKRNLRIKTIQIEDEETLVLHFDCSWNEEHGLLITLKNNRDISFE